MLANQTALLAIAKLSSAPSPETRAALYEALCQGNLLLVGNSEQMQQCEAVELSEDIRMDLLCTTSPSGGKALVAFTDLESLRNRTAHDGVVELSAVSILKLVISSGYDGLIINPAGPWAGIPATDIPELINGMPCS